MERIENKTLGELEPGHGKSCPDAHLQRHRGIRDRATTPTIQVATRNLTTLAWLRNVEFSGYSSPRLVAGALHQKRPSRDQKIWKIACAPLRDVNLR